MTQKKNILIRKDIRIALIYLFVGSFLLTTNDTLHFNHCGTNMNRSASDYITGTVFWAPSLLASLLAIDYQRLDRTNLCTLEEKDHH